MARLLLAIRADPDRVAVLEVLGHGADERDVDRVRVPRVSRRSVTDVDLVHFDHPAGPAAGTCTRAHMCGSVGRHRDRGPQYPALEEGSLSLEELLEINRSEFRGPEEGPVSATVAGELADRAAEPPNHLAVVAGR